MDLKSTLNFEVTKNERSYRFSIPLGAPYGEAYDAVLSCLENILELQKKGIEQLKSQMVENEALPAATTERHRPVVEPVVENPNPVQP